MSGKSLLTKKVDVYAFGMCCVEVVTSGSIPWPTLNDIAVKRDVLGGLDIEHINFIPLMQPTTVNHSRPPFPATLVEELGLTEVLHSSWHSAPATRPSFRKLRQSMETLRGLSNHVQIASPLTPPIFISPPSARRPLDPHPPTLGFLFLFSAVTCN